MRKETFSKRKIGKQLVSVMMLGLAVSPIISSATSVLAEEPTNEATASTDVSAQLKAAIEKARSLGINVDSTEKKTFQSTAELNDFNTKQLVQLNEAITKAEKNVSASKADEEEYNKAKAEYDKKKADYDTQKADYDKAKSTYDAAKTKYDADLKAYESAKTKYDSDLKSYEAAKTKYDSDLKAYESSTDSNKKAQEEYNKKKAEYDAAKAKYDADLKTYEAAKADYDRKLAEYEAGAVNDKKAQEEYNRKKAEYDAAKAKYDSEIAKMEADKTKDGHLSQAAAQSLVYQSEPNAIATASNLVNAQPITRSGLQRAFNRVGLDRYYIDELVNNKEAFNIAISSTGATQESLMTFGKKGLGDGKDTITAYRISRNGSLTIDYTNLKNSSYNGEPLSKVSMTISIDPSSKNLSENGIVAFTQNPKLGFNVQFRKSDDNNKRYLLKFNVTMKFYDSKGNLINLTDENKALLGMSSFNSHQEPVGIVEGFSTGQGTSVIGITGSSIQNQDGRYYSIKRENTDNQFGYNNIDSTNNPFFWYLGSVLKMTGSSPTFQVFSGDPTQVGRPEPSRTYIPGLWMTATSELATTVALKPAPPTPPGRANRTKPAEPTKPTQPTPPTPVVTQDTPKPVEPKKPTEPTKPTEPKAPTAPAEPTAPVKKTNNADPINAKITDAVVVITKHVEVGTGKELAPQEEGTKPKKSIEGYEFVETKTEDGNTIHFYKPVNKVPIKPKEDKKVYTRHIDKDTGKEIAPREDGKQPKKDIPGYRFVETKDKDGNTDHYYEKVKTRHYDITTGKELAPEEEGTQPKKDIPGYEFVETKDKNGDTEHFYKPVKKVVTKHIDKKTGKELVPQEDGTQPKKDIPGYRFVETKDEDGNTIHYYEQVITKHLEVETNKELAPQEDGTQPKKDIEGYEFVETKDEDGDTIHYYKPVTKVYTKHIDKDTGKELAPQEDGKQPKREFEGYEFVETKDDNGNTIHYYQKLKTPTQIKGKTPTKYAETNESSGTLATIAGLSLASVLAFFVKKRKSN